jgi:uracil-DNA glycosylase
MIVNLFKNDWDEILQDELHKPYFHKMGVYIQNEITLGKTIYPEPKDFFKALKLTSYKNTKIVIVGQEPYTNGESDGLAFSCREDAMKYPFALETIFKAIEEDIYKGFKVEQDGNLERWANQGILLLNKTLSVEKQKPESHTILDWDKFITAIIYKLQEKNEPVLYLLFGKKTKEVKLHIVNKKALIIECEHPNASLYNEDKKWNYNNCFSLTNKFLIDNGYDRIEW